MHCSSASQIQVVPSHSLQRQSTTEGNNGKRNESSCSRTVGPEDVELTPSKFISKVPDLDKVSRKDAIKTEPTDGIKRKSSRRRYFGRLRRYENGPVQVAPQSPSSSPAPLPIVKAQKFPFSPKEAVKSIGYRKIEAFSLMGGDRLMVFRTMAETNPSTKLIVGKSILKCARTQNGRQLARLRRQSSDAVQFQETLVFVGSSHAFRTILKENLQQSAHAERRARVMLDLDDCNKSASPKTRKQRRSRTCWDLPETPRPTNLRRLGELSQGIGQDRKSVV